MCTLVGLTLQWDEIITDAIVQYNGEGYTVIPHLRPLSSITEYEAGELISIHLGRPPLPCGDYLNDVNYGESTMMEDILGNPSAWLYLLSKGFDLFGLIEAGLAKRVDK